MFINDTWKFEDKVSGLRLTVEPGKGQNCLHIENIGGPMVDNRDFFFAQDGEFVGTGSSC